MKGMVACFCLLWTVLVFAGDDLHLVVDAKASQFTVSLPANPSTGYQWTISTYDKAHFESMSHQYIASTHVRRMGAGGSVLFIFERKKGVDNPDCTQMVFRYARPWDPKSGQMTRVMITFKKIHQKNH